MASALMSTAVPTAATTKSTAEVLGDVSHAALLHVCDLVSMLSQKLCTSVNALGDLNAATNFDDLGAVLSVVDNAISNLGEQMARLKGQRDVASKLIRSRILQRSELHDSLTNPNNPNSGLSDASEITTGPPARWRMENVAISPSVGCSPSMPVVSIPATDILSIPNLCLFNESGSNVFCLKINNHVIRGSLQDVYTPASRRATALVSSNHGTVASASDLEFDISRYCTVDASGSDPNFVDYSWRHVNAGAVAGDCLVKWGKDLPNTRLISGRRDIGRLAHVNPYELDLRCRQLMHDLLIVAWLTSTHAASTNIDQGG